MKSVEAKAWLEGIEGEAARELIESNAPVIRVVAGPGTGKTTCLKQRTRRLIEGDGVDPRKIYVGTFTRAIANELREELSSEIEVSTLHSLALKLLNEYPEACQGMFMRFLLNFEQDVMLYDIEQDSAPISFGDMGQRQDELKKMQANRAQRIEYKNAAFAGAVRRWLIRYKSMLVGEVVYLAVTGLESEDIPNGMFDHVVIDEYQDLTAAEQELVNFIWSRSGSLTVMGDDDQSIYGFRYNHPSGISDFHESWADYMFSDLKFIENRRCGDQILEIANAMMEEAGSHKPRMLPMSGCPGRLDAVRWNNLEEEISGLSKFIQSRPDESFLVLVPRRYIGYRLSDDIGDDAQTSFMEETLEHSIVKEAFAAASMLADPSDWVATRVWLGFEGEKAELATGRNSIAFASLPNEIGGHDLLRKIADKEIIVKGNGEKNIRLRAKQAIELIEKDLEPEEVVSMLFNPEKSALEKDKEKSDWLAVNLIKFQRAAKEILSTQETKDLKVMLETLRYRIATRLPLNEVSEKARVKIMTLHSAKGLDAQNVIIASVADQLIPGRDLEYEKVEEQRRLLYVAITRARESLVVSWPQSIHKDIMSNRKVFGRKVGWPRYIDGKLRYKTTRSRLLPQGLTGVISGKKWLEASCSQLEMHNTHLSD